MKISHLQGNSIILIYFESFVGYISYVNSFSTSFLLFNSYVVNGVTYIGPDINTGPVTLQNVTTQNSTDVSPIKGPVSIQGQKN